MAPVALEMVPVTVPPDMRSSPPLKIDIPLAVPPLATSNSPPLDVVVALAVPE
jgi:hypothetical protein